MRKFLIGAAAIALAATGAVAEPGGKGGGGGKGGPDHAAMGHGGGKPDAGKPEAGKPDRGPAEDRGRGKAERGGEKRAERGSETKVERAAERVAERRGDAKRAEIRQVERAERAVERAAERRAERGDRPVREARGERDARFRDDTGRIVRTDWFEEGNRRYGLIDGCPPGLAKKNTGCLPPGLAKKRDGDWRDAAYQPRWWGFDRLDEGRYVYDDGYLYRLGANNSLLGYIPLLGGALSIGNPWPAAYEPYPVPQYYRDYYNLGPVDSYRYADDVLYRVDPSSGVIESIAALLTGDRFAVGQPLPTGYDVYNVPYGYQEQYYDTDDAQYRYADGYVYEVDPATQLITAVIELLA